MSHEIQAEEPARALCLRVVAEPDPGALARVLNHFLSLNAVPRRVVAEFGFSGMQYIRIDVVGMTERALSLIAGKLAQAPLIENAYWHRL